MTTASQNGDSGTGRTQRQAAPTRRQVFLPTPPDGPIARIAALGGEEDLPSTVVAMSNRYLAAIQHSMPSLTDREWGVIFDALRWPWTAEPHLVAQLHKDVATAIDSDGLDLKWGVDGKRLRNRLNRASYLERMAIAEMTMAFYHRLETGKPATIEALTALFQPQAPERPTPSVPRLSPALLLGEEAAGETAAAYRAALSASSVTEAPPRPDTETAPAEPEAPPTETDPDGPPGGPEPPLAPPTGPESSSPAMALDTGPGADAPSATEDQQDTAPSAGTAQGTLTEPAGDPAPDVPGEKTTQTAPAEDPAPDSPGEETTQTAPEEETAPEEQTAVTASNEETTTSGMVEDAAPTTPEDESATTTPADETGPDENNPAAGSRVRGGGAGRAFGRRGR